MPLNPWMIALVTTVAAMLLRGSFRSHGWARFTCVALAVAVMLGAVWYAVAKAGEQAENQASNAIGKMWQGASPTPASGPVRWHGRVTLSASGGLNLDQAPPKPDGSPDIRLGTAPDQIQGAVYGGEGNLAPWSDRAGGAPDALACLLQIAAAPRLRMTVHAGSTVCLQTASGRVAALTFTSVGGGHEPDSAEATIWSEQVARRLSGDTPRLAPKRSSIGIT